MRSRTPRKPRPPLNDESLKELALYYLGRFATTRAKLGDYLRRKIRERGWEGEGPDVEGMIRRFAEAGLVDDAAFALSRSRSLSERGYGAGRVRQALRAAGIDEEDGVEARELAEEEKVEAALRFARRRRIGPFAEEKADPKRREKALAAMVRAGHSFELARKLVNFEPGEAFDETDLASNLR